MYKLLWTIIFQFIMGNSFAMTARNISAFFEGETACFILYDVNKEEIIELYNPKHCAERVSPESTFKIALSLMAFDKKIINQNTIFKWDGLDKGLTNWNQNQTPFSWLKNSAIWVSQLITPKLNNSNIDYYLKNFDYGNRDFSGGLTTAWLSSSLKISANEQMFFLRKLILNELPISLEAMRETKSNMYLETLNGGWKLYGKTGTGFKTVEKAGGENSLQSGWFMGYVEKDNQIYLFVLNFCDYKAPNSSEIGGIRAKNTIKLILNESPGLIY